MVKDSDDITDTAFDILSLEALLLVPRYTRIPSLSGKHDFNNDTPGCFHCSLWIHTSVSGKSLDFLDAGSLANERLRRGSDSLPEANDQRGERFLAG